MTTAEPIVPSALILVVDDDDDVRDVAAATLRGAGYRILEAGGGGQALALLEANAGLTLIFTDIVMPGIDGFKLAEIAKTLRPDLKILYTTGYTHLADAQAESAHGTMLKKPYRPAQLLKTVRQLLA